MSRVVVKNLPKGTTAKKLEEIFSARGEITDLQLKYNKQGVFRQFAFIGFKTEEEASAAKEFFHNTFIHTSKIKVEICTSLGDPNKPKPRKKIFEIKEEKQQIKDIKDKSPKKKKNADDFVPEELKNDPQFKEYLGVNKDRKSKPVWGEDVDLSNSDSESKDESSETDGGEDGSTADESHEKKLNTSKKNKAESKDPLETKISDKQKKYQDLFTVKLTNLPYHCKKTHIKKFFASLKIASLRIPPKKKGFAFVGFKTEKDLKQALIKNKGFLDGHCIQVVKYGEKNNSSGKPGQNGKFPDNDKELNEDLLAETGRIYVRNLCYTVTEADIEKLFVKYGPIAELFVPIDYNTQKSKGFAFVTFMFAEHALKAFSELDGTTFQGRMLHLIPGRARKEFDTSENETNFKKKKEAERKKESGSSHNWNIVFLGKNAVADAISEKYKIAKSELLSGDAKNKSAAVRMALAETELVEKTRTFLLENGVQLDAFSQPAAQRSKTVLVVKDLPARTTSKELYEKFSEHGTISRVLLAPTKMCALVEFQNPTEAKTAFTKLAYSRFYDTPLYLEWAPMDGLKDPPALIYAKKEDSKEQDEEEKESNEQNSTENVSNDIPIPEGTTIYVKNINFSTTQESLEKHFKQCGPIYSATISTKKDLKTGKVLSMGFGFVQFRKKESAIFALQNLQHSILDGHSLELKFAHRSTVPTPVVKRKKYEVKKQTSSKILVRNIPFQASVGDVSALFKEFGTLKKVRLPKKKGKESREHRGFGFVEYEHAEEAKRAFEALCHSTHLWNRRLVLEWAKDDSDNVSELMEKTAKRYFEGEPMQKVKKSKLKDDVVMAATRYGALQDDDDNEEDGDE